MQKKLGIVLSAREELYYSAAEALNAFNTSTSTFDSQEHRYSAFKEHCLDLYDSYPEDENAAAYALLSLQVGSPIHRKMHHVFTRLLTFKK